MPTIDWAHFTPWTSLWGGVIIGLAVVLMLVLNGRVTGVSGIIGGVLQRNQNNQTWRWAFILGMIVVPLVLRLNNELPDIVISAGWLELVIAGLLVGFGTRLGSGCTSGHGICGISRFSTRSLSATLIFMATGFVVVYFMRHVIGSAL